MAPVTNASRCALIVSHGQPSDPAHAEAALRGLAERVGQRLPDWTIRSATMAAKGALQNARKQHPAATIYPLFMADGWFTGTALPKSLIESDQQHLLPPLGMDHRLPTLAVDILTQVLATQDWQMSETCLIIAAHGGKTSKNPAKAAVHFTNEVRDLGGFWDVRLGFVEEQPELSSIAHHAGKRAICLPFFAANGRHVRGDIPAALRVAGFQGVTLDAIGHAAQIPDLIAQSLRQAIGRH
ncbi:CbiX/SirB N-terminal domain-containing protein [Profundibacter sp.]